MNVCESEVTGLKESSPMTKLKSLDRDEFVRRLCARHDDDTLTIDEVAVWLNKTRSWVLQHASTRRRPHVPGVKDGKTYTFRWGTLKEWRKSLERKAA